MKIFRLAAIAAFATIANSAAHASGIPTADVLVATLMEQQTMKDAAYYAQYAEDKLKELEIAYNSYMNLYNQARMMEQNLSFNGFTAIESPEQVFSAFNQLRSVRNQYVNAYNGLAGAVNNAISAGCQIYDGVMLCDADKVSEEQKDQLAAEINARAAAVASMNDENKAGSYANLLKKQGENLSGMNKKLDDIVKKGPEASDREIASLGVEATLALAKEMHIANQLKLSAESRAREEKINEDLAIKTQDEKLMKAITNFDGVKNAGNYLK